MVALKKRNRLHMQVAQPLREAKQHWRRRHSAAAAPYHGRRYWRSAVVGKIQTLLKEIVIQCRLGQTMN